MDRIVVDPSLYLQESAPLMYAVENRSMPDAFTIFGGQLLLQNATKCAFNKLQDYDFCKLAKFSVLL